MKLSLTKCLKAVGFIVAISMAQGVYATTLTFDDLSNPNALAIPNGYGGLNWYFVSALDSSEPVYTDSGYPNGAVSGSNVAFFGGYFMNSYITSSSPIDFNGAYLTAAWSNLVHITVEGYRGLDLLYSTNLTVNSTEPTWFNFNYLGVDTLSFHTYGGIPSGYRFPSTIIAMDNFTYNAPVPLPAAFWLFGSGLIGLFGFMRRGRSTYFKIRWG